MNAVSELRVEPGSDQINAEILERTGTDESAVNVLVDAEDAETAAEEERLAAVEAATPELESSETPADTAPPADERHDEFEELPEFSPGM